jgi:hypothetical protein
VIRRESKRNGIASKLRLRRVALAGVLALAALAVAPVTSQAARPFDTSFAPFNQPLSVSFAENGDVWVADRGQGGNPPGFSGLYRYDPYPSQMRLAQPITNPPWDYDLNIQAAVDHSTGDVFVAQANAGRRVDIFDDDGYSHSWTAINGVSTFEGIQVAIDNTNGDSRGRIYLSLPGPENDVEAFDYQQLPIDFPATAPYIEGHKLTGTPEGPFGKVYQISVDHLGNIYVTDTLKNEVDEFNSTGEFVRSFPAPQSAPPEGTNGFGGVAIDPTNGDVLIAQGGFNGFEGGVMEYDESGNFLGRIVTDPSPPNSGGFYPQGTPAADAAGHVYVPTVGKVDIFGPAAARPSVVYQPVAAPGTSSGTLRATIDPDGGGPVTKCYFEYGPGVGDYSADEIACSPDPATAPPGSNFTVPTEVSAAISGLDPEQTYHYRVVVENAATVKYGQDRTYTPHGVIGLRTDAATGVEETAATLNGSLLGDGTPTGYLFEWGRTADYGNVSASAPGESIGSPSGPDRTPLSLDLSGLDPYSTYHYRIVATGGSGTSYGEDQVFTTPPGIPTVRGERVTEVHSDRAILHGEVRANGISTTYDFEYVDDQHFQQNGFSDALVVPATPVEVGRGKTFRTAQVTLDGIAPGTTYHYRLVGANSAGVGVSGAEKTFRTYPFGFEDKCPNAHVRQQTGSALLLDCRAYELASAANAGGYDVESDLVPGQAPYPQYPLAQGPSRVLYGVHGGGIPGTGRPTNHGVDPYVATRGEGGWTTRYVGIPADNPFAGGPFASTLAEADATLDTFAFGGPAICDPCFEDGSSGQPVRLPDGTLVQGMAGSSTVPGAEEAGHVAKRLSADGSHFVFGSTAKFTADGNSNGDVTIYSRDLNAKTTRAVSKTPGAATMTGPGIGELDLSSDGSRVVVGQQVDTDSAGNDYWHLYMTVGDSDHSIDLMPNATGGALYDGMTADGTRVFFSTREALTLDDSDSSVDIYRADVDGSTATLVRVSGSGGSGNADDCDPSANTVFSRWNSLEPGPNCDVLAVGGGGGVASGSGELYFLSPEFLDGPNDGNDPVAGAPNLYLAIPGSEPRFIRTLESDANAPLPKSLHPFERAFGSFANPLGLAIDRSNQDVYVLDAGNGFNDGFVYKFNSEGEPSLGFGSGGKLTAPGAAGGANLPADIAADNDPSSPNYRDVFVPDVLNSLVRAFDPAGNFDLSITVQSPSAVAVDPATGRIYVTSVFGGPSPSGGVSVFSPAGVLLDDFATMPAPTGVAVAGGKVYVVNGGGPTSTSGEARIYDTAGTALGGLDTGPAKGVSVDPSDEHVYVDHGGEVIEYDAGGAVFGQPVGAGVIANSTGVAAADGEVVATNKGSTNVASFGPPVIPPDPAVDNPVVIDSLASAAARHQGDFQVTGSGAFAAFTSTLPLTGYDNGGHREVFRYGSATEKVACISCNPTGEQATGDSALAQRGLSLAEDGRVFFNSIEGLVDRDLNKKGDAYEWKAGEGVQLISTGAAALGASLLGVSADGTDAYFFTREKLVAEDQNGSRVKIYDARSFGGFPFIPAAAPCRASDECHGPGSPTPPAPNIGTVAGTPIGNAGRKPAKCKLRKGKCKHKKHRKRRKHRKQHKQTQGVRTGG